MRLIDANKLLEAMKRLTGAFSPMVVRNLIDNQPTVYDKDNIIDELNERIYQAKKGMQSVETIQEAYFYSGLDDGFNTAIEIIERGGVDNV